MIIDFNSIGLVCDSDKLFGFDCVICGNSLPVSFKSDCVLNTQLCLLLLWLAFLIQLLVYLRFPLFFKRMPVWCEP